MSLAVAVLENDKEAVFDCIFNDANVNEGNDVGNTPLHAAAFTGNVPVAELLVRAGARVNAQNHLGRTPLMVAALNNHVDMVTFLLGHEADAKIRDGQGRSARDMASDACAAPLDAWLDDVIATLVDADDSRYVAGGAAVGNVRTRFKASSSASHNNNTNSSTRIDPAEKLLSSLEKFEMLHSNGDNDKPPVRLKHQESSSSAKAPSNPVVFPPASPTNTPPPAAAARSRLSSDSPGQIPKSPSNEAPRVSPRQQQQNQNHQQHAGSSNGFFVEVDGLNVFVPMPVHQQQQQQQLSHDPFLASSTVIPSPATKIPIDQLNPFEPPPPSAISAPHPPPAHTSVHTLDSQRQEIVRISFQVQSRGGDEGLGMLLREDAHGVIRVHKVKRRSPAAHAGVKRADVVVEVNGKLVPGLALSEVVGLLHASSAPHICVERVLPSIVLLVARGIVKWSDPSRDLAQQHVHDLVTVLNEPPANLTPDQLLGAIHSFQECVDGFRRHEGGFLAELLVDALGGMPSEIVERAAALVHRAFRFLELDNEDETGGDDNNNNNDDDDESLLHQVLSGILEGTTS